MIHNRLVLIDSFALIYRAFFGMPMSLTHDGHPINAAYGFTSALLASIKELQPEYLAAAFDLPKPTKRKQEYAEYKAHRKPMPEDLIPQIQYCKEILKALNIPIVTSEGYEGEDVIATIIRKLDMSNEKLASLQNAHHSSRISNIKSIIVTGDSDTYQLIDETTKVYSMARGGKLAEMIDAEKVKERYGLEPSQFVDFKALKGDASDNIPGVKGIGEKTAAKLIQEFGTLDKLYAAIGNDNDARIGNESRQTTDEPGVVTDKLKTLFLENKETAYLSQKLSKIDDQAPIDFKLSDAKVHDYDVKKVTKLFNELGFKSLISRLPDSQRKDNQQTLF